MASLCILLNWCLCNLSVGHVPQSLSEQKALRALYFILKAVVDWSWNSRVVASIKIVTSTTTSPKHDIVIAPSRP